VCRNPGLRQLAGASALADPFRRGSGLSIGRSHADVAAETNDVAEAEFTQEGEQLLVAEAAVGQDRHPAALRQGFSETAQAGILIVVGKRAPTTTASTA
jgi:hypothetical protein